MIESLHSHPLTLRARFALLTAMFAIAVGYGIVMPMLPFLLEKLASKSDPAMLSRHTGLLSGTYATALFLFAPFWGKLSDAHGRRPVILLGLLGFAASLGLLGLMPSLTILYIARFLAGLFAAAVAPAAYALICDHAPSEEWRAHRFALINVAGSAGAFVGPLAGSTVLRGSDDMFSGGTEETFATVFLAAAGAALMAALAIWRLVPSFAEMTDQGSDRADRRSEWPLVARLCSIVFVTATAVGAFEVALSLRGKQTLGMDAFQVAMMFTECGLVMLMVQTLVLSPLIKPQMTRWLLGPALAALAIGLILIPLAKTHTMIMLDIAIVAASAGAVFPIVTYWVSFHAGSTRGANLGRVTGTASLGQALGSTTSGLLFDSPILPNAAFAAATVIVMVGVALSLALPRLLMNEPSTLNGD